MSVLDWLGPEGNIVRPGGVSGSTNEKNMSVDNRIITHEQLHGYISRDVKIGRERLEFIKKSIFESSVSHKIKRDIFENPISISDDDAVFNRVNSMLNKNESPDSILNTASKLKDDTDRQNLQLAIFEAYLKTDPYAVFTLLSKVTPVRGSVDQSLDSRAYILSTYSQGTLHTPSAIGEDLPYSSNDSMVLFRIPLKKLVEGLKADQIKVVPHGRGVRITTLAGNNEEMSKFCSTISPSEVMLVNPVQK